MEVLPKNWAMVQCKLPRKQLSNVFSALKVGGRPHLHHSWALHLHRHCPPAKMILATHASGPSIHSTLGRMVGPPSPLLYAFVYHRFEREGEPRHATDCGYHPSPVVNILDLQSASPYSSQWILTRSGSVAEHGSKSESISCR